MAYARKFTAKRAALTELGKNAKEGTDFQITTVDGGFAWEKVPTAAALDIPHANTETLVSDNDIPAFLKRGKPEPQVDSSASERMAETEQPKVDIVPVAPAKLARAARASNAPGVTPVLPDFSAATHKPFRKRLAEVQAMFEAGDLTGLKAAVIPTYSSSPRAIDRYRNAAVAYLEASGAPAKRLTEMSADEFDAGVIRKATVFTATKFKGRGVYDTRTTDSLEHAMSAGRELGRGTMIYALSPEGRKALVATLKKDDAPFNTTKAAQIARAAT